MRRNRFVLLAAALCVLVLSTTAVGAQSAPQATGKYVLNDDGASLAKEPGVRPTNHVLKIDTTSGTYGSMSRLLGVEPDTLDGALSFDYFIESGDCGGGSPRLILSVDNNGDTEHDFFLVTDGPDSPGWGSCPDAAGQWASFDATDGGVHWRIHPGAGYLTWEGAKAALGPDAMVLSGAIVDDSFWLGSAAGVAYYDNVTIGDRTFTDPSDVLGN